MGTLLVDLSLFLMVWLGWLALSHWYWKNKDRKIGEIVRPIKRMVPWYYVLAAFVVVAGISNQVNYDKRQKGKPDELADTSSYGPYKHEGKWQLASDIQTNGSCDNEKVYRVFDGGKQQLCLNDRNCLDASETPAYDAPGQYATYVRWGDDPHAVKSTETYIDANTVSSRGLILNPQAFYKYFSQYGQSAKDADEKMKFFEEEKVFKHCR